MSLLEIHFLIACSYMLSTGSGRLYIFHFTGVSSACCILWLALSCSLHELLRHEHNGLIFNDHKELADQLQVWPPTLSFLRSICSAAHLCNSLDHFGVTWGPTDWNNCVRLHSVERHLPWLTPLMFTVHAYLSPGLFSLILIIKTLKM